MDLNSSRQASIARFRTKASIAAACLLLPLSACGLPGTTAPAAHSQAASQAVPPPRPVPPPRASALVGDAPDAVEAALGPPVLRHNEGPAEVWLYATADGCRLDLVLYADGSGSHVAHADTRTPTHMSEAACLRAIADAAS
jgi:hypothetical protein